MILTCHLLAGAAIAAGIPNFALGLLLAFLSHYFLDLIPHREYSVGNIFEKRWRKSRFDFLKAFLDFSLGVLLIFILSKNFIPALLGGLSALLPDGLVLLYLIFEETGPQPFPTSEQESRLFFSIKKRGFNLLKQLREVHLRVHFWKNKRIPLFWKIQSQVLVIVLAIIFLR